MENQNATTQEKKKLFTFHGKKKKVIIIGIVALFLLGLIGRGIGFRSVWGKNNHPFFGTGNVAVSVKDFEPLGVVFAESLVSTRDGYGTTYNALMKEAAQKGADAITNVNISATGRFFNRSWSGSALAIKYLETIPGEVAMSGEFGNTALLLRSRRGSGRGWF
jgi:hypothetical protein